MVKGFRIGMLVAIGYIGAVLILISIISGPVNTNTMLSIFVAAFVTQVLIITFGNKYK